MTQMDFEAAFAAADARADAEQRRSEFRTLLIKSLKLREGIEVLLIALDEIAELHGEIDEDGNSWISPSKREIAQQMERSISTAIRAYQDAEILGYLKIEKIAGKRSEFAILWPVIFEQAIASQEASKRGVKGGVSRDVTASKNGGTWGSTSSSTTSSSTTSGTAKNGGTRGVKNASLHEGEVMNMNLHEFMKDGDLEIGQEEKPRRRSISLMQVDQEKKQITLSGFDEPREVERLWRLCLDHPDLKDLYRDHEYDRRLFFQWAHLISRKRDKFSNPIGFFHKILAQGKPQLLRQVDDSHDLAWAQSAIDLVDGREQRAKPDSPQPRRPGNEKLAGMVLRELGELSQYLTDDDRALLEEDPNAWVRNHSTEFRSRCRQLVGAPS